MKTVMIDTDLGCDCDDAGALAVAHHLADNQICHIAAITHCTSEIAGLNAVYAINSFYGRENISSGIYKPQGFLDGSEYHGFTRGIQSKFGAHYPSKAYAEDAVKTLRRGYAQTAVPITLIELGPSALLCSFITSCGDEISPKTGTELIAENGGDLVMMAGSFNSDHVEWNVEQDIAAARTVVTKWPNKLYMLPYEAGADILTGTRLLNRGTDDPITYAYRSFLGSSQSVRSSWDQCTVHFAVTRSEKLWRCSEAGAITVGQTGKTSFFCDSQGRHYYVMPLSSQSAAEIIDDCMAELPARTYKNRFTSQTTEGT